METITLNLTQAEIDYIWLLTSLDITRIDQSQRNHKDETLLIRHNLRTKLYTAETNKKAPAK